MGWTEGGRNWIHRCAAFLPISFVLLSMLKERFCGRVNSVCLSVCLSVSLSLCLCLCLSLFLSPPHPLSLSPFLSLVLFCLPVSVVLVLSVCLSVCPPPPPLSLSLSPFLSLVLFCLPVSVILFLLLPVALFLSFPALFNHRSR